MASDLPAPAARVDGGYLDCGGGLLLLIRRAIDPLERGQVLEVLSTEPSVGEDLPAWCRLTGNPLLDVAQDGPIRRFLVRRGGAAALVTVEPRAPVTQTPPAPTPAAHAATAVAPLSVMGIGSWPRPRWLLSALHDRLERRLDDAAFEATADDAVRLAIAAQERAGADVVTDGEQRRDSYASFIGARLDGAELVPLTDLLPLVDRPEELEAAFRTLDVPAAAVRHPVVTAPLRRTRPIAAHELAFARTLTTRPVKVALPGPYLLSRVLWLECLTDRAYDTRAALCDDIVRVLREELNDLLAGGAALVQLDEPVLTEVVHGRAGHGRTFMCGALAERGETSEELGLARDLLARVLDGLPADRLALHVCRGNWTPDEGAALTGDYRPLVELFSAVPVGTLCLECCTPRAGELEVLRRVPDDRRIGVGVVNPKDPRVETEADVLARARRAVELFGRERVLLVPDCGFATFADNPVAAAAVAEGKLAAMAAAARVLRAG